MSDRATVIRQRLQEAFAPATLDIVDESHKHAGHAGARSGGGHFAVYLVSPAFAGKSPIERHRMVYTALGQLMTSDIHALSVKALTPEET
jgi:BolA protein